MSNVIKLASKSPKRAVEALNRMTGLVFDQWPESLVGLTAQEPAERKQADNSEPVVMRQRAGS